MAEEEKDLSAEADNAPPAEAAVPPASEALERELEAAKAKAAEYLDGWQRSQADFQNYKRRVDRERADIFQAAAGKVIARYLDVLDDFDRAMKDQPGEGATPEAVVQWSAGIGLIHRKFQNVLDAEGVTRIQAEGQPFDPNLHEAVVHEESDAHASGQVIEVLRHGYKTGERVIRPALVKVAR